MSDINTVKTLFRTNLPQAGFDITGASKSVKQFVVAQVINYNYDTGAAEYSAFSPKSIGLKSFDYIHFEVRAWKTAAGGAAPDTYPATATGNAYSAYWNASTQKIVLVITDTNVVPSDNFSFEVRVLAVGDSAAGVEQL
jgi:hypothetical protein